MKLYEIPQGSKILLPISSEDGKSCEEKICTFKHTDGMYSLILTPDGSIVHLSANAEVELVNGHYEMI